MTRPGLFAWSVATPVPIAALFPLLTSWHYPLTTMKSCCEQAGGPPPKGPTRRFLTYALYAALAAVLGFVLWQQFQA
jgi:hypothetical protein